MEGRKPEVRLRRIEGFEPSAQSRQGGRPKDFFEMSSIKTLKVVHISAARLSALNGWRGFDQNWKI
jgi:hypothetical protein